MGVSINKGSQNKPKSTMILVTRNPKQGPSNSWKPSNLNPMPCIHAFEEGSLVLSAQVNGTNPLPDVSMPRMEEPLGYECPTGVPKMLQEQFRRDMKTWPLKHSNFKIKTSRAGD